MSASRHHFQSLPDRDPGQGIAVSEARSPSRAVSGTVSISDATMVLLKAIAAHDRVSVAELVCELTCDRAKTIGLSRLARAVADLNAEGGVH